MQLWLVDGNVGWLYAGYQTVNQQLWISDMTGANEQTIPEGTEDAPKVSLSLEISIAGEKVQFTVPVPSGRATWEDLLPFMRALVKVSSDISQD